jgi:hypothetical protein
MTSTRSATQARQDTALQTVVTLREALNQAEAAALAARRAWVLGMFRASHAGNSHMAVSTAGKISEDRYRVLRTENLYEAWAEGNRRDLHPLAALRRGDRATNKGGKPRRQAQHAA